MSDETLRQEPSLRERSRSPGQTLGGQNLGGQNLGGERRQPGKGVLELTEAIAEDGSVRRLSPARAPLRAEGQEEAASARSGESRPNSGTAYRGSETLAAGAAGTAAEALAPLATLGREKRREGETPLGSPGQTLEDVVRDLLRPILEAWLAENLPGLTERLVREEIARVVREAGLR